MFSNNEIFWEVISFTKQYLYSTKVGKTLYGIKKNYRRSDYLEYRESVHTKNDIKDEFLFKKKTKLLSLRKFTKAESIYKIIILKKYIKLIEKNENKLTVSLINNKKFNLNRYFLEIDNSGRITNLKNNFFINSLRRFMLYIRIRKSKRYVNLFYITYANKALDDRAWLKLLFSYVNNFNFEVYFNGKKNNNLNNYYYNEKSKYVLRGNNIGNILLEKWMGTSVWKSSKLNIFYSDINLPIIVSNFKNKLKRDSIKYLSIAMIPITARQWSNFKYYKRTAKKLSQSWGNFGRSSLLNFTNKKTLKMIQKNNFKVSKKQKIKRIRVVSKNKYFYLKKFLPKTIMSASKINLDTTYHSWAKAGYIMISHKKELKSKIKRSSVSTYNFSITSDSKVFGHPFHLVTPSILPLTMSFVFFTVIQDILSSFWLEMWYSSNISVLAHGVMIGFFFSVILTWMLEIYSEEQAGYHTLEVQKGFQYGILLFILSEFMLFVSFFWAYFHFSLNSNSFTGGSYTPVGLVPFFWYRIPLLNTLLLLSSGLSLTVAHMLIVESDKLVKVFIWFDILSSQFSVMWKNMWNRISGGFKFNSKKIIGLETYFVLLSTTFFKRIQQLSAKTFLSKSRTISMSQLKNNKLSGQGDKVGRISNDFQINMPKSYLIKIKSQPKNTIWQPNFWILDTVLKGFVFLIYQAYEYTSCMFSINDGTYGAVFFSLTGLHGIHVFLGVMFLFFSLIVNLKKNFKKKLFSFGKLNMTLNAILERGLITKTSYNQKIWTHRIAFDGAAWYWHFVDVVWLFVFVFIYWWGFSGDIVTISNIKNK